MDRFRPITKSLTPEWAGPFANYFSLSTPHLPIDPVDPKNEASTLPVVEIGPGPFEERKNAASEIDEEHKVNEDPCQPSNVTAEL